MEIIREITIGEIGNILILGITAWVVWQYTKAAQTSNEINERPILNLYLHDKFFKVRNEGNGPAYNIEFYGIVTDKSYEYHPYFDEPNPILERGGDTKPLKFWLKTPDGRAQMFSFSRFLMHLFPKDIPKEQYETLKRSNATFLITYEGINDTKHYSIFRLYPKTRSLLGTYHGLVVEFIKNGEGNMDLEKAELICSKKPTMKKFNN